MADIGFSFMKRMPPTLILHGEMDLIVPVSNAHRLERHYKANKLPYEIKIYKVQGHGFTGEDGKDSSARTLAFFNKHLKEKQ
jgi:dipeptidyl aminopeptidase/acylaminoacyl peptidase